MSEDQLQRHLNMQGRSVSSLLTALRISENLDYLREAYDRYPDDPDVLLELAMRSESPEERREAIDVIRKLDPDWGIPDYLLALEQAKAGDRQAAVRTFLEAGSNKFLDYSILETSEEIEQVYLDNGFPLHEAKFLGIMTIPLSSVKPLMELAKEMNSLQADFLKKGDTASAPQLAQAARSLNQQKQAEAFTIAENLVGDAFEVSLLKKLPPTTDLGSGVTAGQRLADLRTKKDQKNKS